MSCCGSLRQNWREYTNKPTADAQQPLPAPTLQAAGKVRYTGEGSTFIKGAVTGYVYVFSGSAEGLAVDGRDLAAILQRPGFEKVASAPL
jgi:hypothetical protein